MENEQPQFISRKQLAFSGATSFQLIIETKSRRTANLTITGATKEGVFTLTHTTLSTLVLQTEIFRIPDVPIWVTVADEGNVFLNGETYVSISLGINDNKISQLAAGYISGLQKLSWPNTNIQQKIGNSLGLIKTITTADPAAGAQISQTVPAGVIWKIKAIRARLITDATVANRSANFILTLPDGGIIKAMSSNAHAASTTIDYLAANYGTSGTSIPSGEYLLGLPADVYLPEGSTITTSITLGVAGDNWGAATIWVEEFIV